MVKMPIQVYDVMDTWHSQKVDLETYFGLGLSKGFVGFTFETLV